MVFGSASYNDFVELCVLNGLVEIFKFGGDNLVKWGGGQLLRQLNFLKRSS